MNFVLNERIANYQGNIPILYFRHLPRTGGTTISRMLKYAFVLNAAEK